MRKSLCWLRSFRWLWQRVGRRGAFLGFLTTLDCLIGYSLISEAALIKEDLGLPVVAWGWIWIGVGVVLATGVFADRDRFQFGISATFKCAWASVYLRLWVAHVALAWVDFVLWVAFGAVVLLVASWPEVPQEVLPEEPAGPPELPK